MGFLKTPIFGGEAMINDSSDQLLKLITGGTGELAGNGRSVLWFTDGIYSRGFILEGSSGYPETASIFGYVDEPYTPTAPFDTVGSNGDASGNNNCGTYPRTFWYGEANPGSVTPAFIGDTGKRQFISVNKRWGTLTGVNIPEPNSTYWFVGNDIFNTELFSITTEYTTFIATTSCRQAFDTAGYSNLAGVYAYYTGEPVFVPAKLMAQVLCSNGNILNTSSYTLFAGAQADDTLIYGYYGVKGNVGPKLQIINETVNGPFTGMYPQMYQTILAMVMPPIGSGDAYIMAYGERNDTVYTYSCSSFDVGPQPTKEELDLCIGSYPNGAGVNACDPSYHGSNFGCFQGPPLTETEFLKLARGICSGKRLRGANWKTTDQPTNRYQLNP